MPPTTKDFIEATTIRATSMIQVRQRALWAEMEPAHRKFFEAGAMYGAAAAMIEIDMNGVPT
jgi:hypothetical protein